MSVYPVLTTKKMGKYKNRLVNAIENINNYSKVGGKRVNRRTYRKRNVLLPHIVLSYTPLGGVEP